MWIILGLVLALPIAAGFAVVMQRQYAYDANIQRIDKAQIFPEEVERPAKPAGDAQNWLLIGSDRRPGETGSQRSDSIMIVHIPADRKRLYVIGIPRDSYVPIPGHGKNKINAAYSFGGPKLLIKTVEKLSKVRIDHFAALDFTGFVTMSKALGGVDVYVAKKVFDPMNDITWPQGKVHLEGERALLFVRQRYNLPGGDFDRIRRQQAFVKAMSEKLLSTGTLTDPFTLDGFLQALTKSISVDSAVTIGTLRDLAVDLRGLRGDDLVPTTVPVDGTGMINGASIVKLDFEATDQLFEAVRADSLTPYFKDYGGTNDLSMIS